MSLLSIPFEALEPQKEEKMESWEKHYAKLKNNKWQTRAGRDEDDNELDEDELYLREERLKQIKDEGVCLCPDCDVIFDVDRDDLFCPECGWSLEDDLTDC